MAQNYKPKSASSGSLRKKGELERAHTRSARRVSTATPKVLQQNQAPGITVAQQRERNRRAGIASSKPSYSSARRNSNPKVRENDGSERGSANGGSKSGAARRQAAVKRKGGIKTKLVVLGIVLLALIGGYIALYNSSFLTINDVQSNGSKVLNREQVLELAAVPEDSTFLRVDTEAIAQRLETNPWIQTASVNRAFPATLVLDITERPMAAVVDIVPEKATDKTTHWLISDNGIWIANLDGDDPTVAGLDGDELAKITKFKDISPAVQPEAGAKTGDPGLVNALAILDGFSPEMRAMVASISAPDKVKATLLLYNNVGVAFGAAEDMQAKEDAIATLLEEHKGTITYINVRVANRATYRATE